MNIDKNLPILVPIRWSSETLSSEHKKKRFMLYENDHIVSDLIRDEEIHQQVRFPNKNESVVSFQSGRDNQAKTHPNPYDSYEYQKFSMTFFLVIYILLSLQRIKRKWKIQSKEDDLDYDIRFSVNPNSNEPHNSGSPWTGDLNKYDV